VEQETISGDDFSAAFSYDVKDKTNFKNRAKYIVKYVAENDLI
jgi:hypothetical protein